MQDRLKKLAVWLERQAWNRPQTDKTWVLQAMWEHRKFVRETRQATLVSDR